MNKKKLIIINSIGPMGSTVLASLIECYGFINLPVRKRGLSLDVTGNRKLKDNGFKKSTLKVIKDGTKLNLIGGTSVLNRKSAKLEPKFKYNKELIGKFKKSKINDIEKLYFKSMELLNKSVIYKKKKTTFKGAIELALDSWKYDNKKLEKSYQKEFSNVYFINCTRSFEGWISTQCAVRFVKKDILLTNCKFNIYKWKKLLKNYNQNFYETEGLNINFDEMFLPKFKKTKLKIEKFLNLKKIPISKLKMMNFDLFGELVPYKKAFIKYDDKQKILSKSTMSFIKFYYKLKFNIFIDTIFSFIFLILYIKDFYLFRIKYSKDIH